MGESALKNCITMEDGTMYCWAEDDKSFYEVNKKKVGINEMPKEAVLRLVDLIKGRAL